MHCNHHKNGKCSCIETYDAIVAGEEIPKLAGYCAIVRESAKHPELLSAFASDLVTHDRRNLTDYSGPFLWILRESSTILVIPENRSGGCGWTGKSILRHATESDVWTWWDESRLRVVSPKQGADLLDMARKCLRRTQAA